MHSFDAETFERVKSKYKNRSFHESQKMICEFFSKTTQEELLLLIDYLSASEDLRIGVVMQCAQVIIEKEQAKTKSMIYEGSEISVYREGHER